VYWTPRDFFRCVDKPELFDFVFALGQQRIDVEAHAATALKVRSVVRAGANRTAVVVGYVLRLHLDGD